MALDLSQHLNDPELLMRLAGAMRARRVPALPSPAGMGSSMYPTQQPVQAGGLPPLTPMAQPMTSMYPQTAGSNILDQLALAFGNIDPRMGYPARGPRNFWEAFGPNFIAGAGRAFATPRLQRMVDEQQHQQAQQEAFKQQQKDYTQAASDLAKRRWQLALAQVRRAPAQTPTQKGAAQAETIGERNRRLREAGEPVPGAPRPPRAPKASLGKEDPASMIRRQLRAAGKNTKALVADWLDQTMNDGSGSTNREWLTKKYGPTFEPILMNGFGPTPGAAK